MTNQQFGSSDTAAAASPPVYDCDTTNMNQEEEEEDCRNQRPSGPVEVVKLTNGGNCISNLNSTPIHQFSAENPEKPPYGTTTEDVECQQRGGGGSSATSWLTVLHMISVVIASATINGVVFGVVNNFGVFYVYLIELFKADTSLLTFAGSDEQAMIPGENATSSSAVDSALLQPLIGKSYFLLDFDLIYTHTLIVHVIYNTILDGCFSFYPSKKATKI